MKNEFLLALSLGGALGACVTTPGTNGHALILTSRDQEAKMGEAAYQEVLAKEHLANNPHANEILQRVGHRIAAVVPVSDFQWEFKLIDSKEMNAFCLPGGKVAVYTGILPVMQNEAGMAIVLGHEITHAVARHGGQRMTQALLVQGGLAAVDIGLLRDSKYHDLLMGLMGVGAGVGIQLPFSRANETEADSLGLHYAAQAGYDPAEGPRFWRRFVKMTAGMKKPPAFLSDHPADEERIKNLENLQREVEPLYEQSPKYGTGEKI